MSGMHNIVKLMYLEEIFRENNIGIEFLIQ